MCLLEIVEEFKIRGSYLKAYDSVRAAKEGIGRDGRTTLVGVIRVCREHVI